MKYKSHGFTIVELLIVIVIIGILAIIVIVAYNGITTKARIATIQSDVSNNVSAVEIYNASNGSYPSTGSDVNDGRGLVKSGSNTSSYYTNSAKTAYCVSSTGPDGTTYAADSLHQTPIAATCGGTDNVVATTPITNGAIIQTITTANCPTTNKVRAVDARDNHTYWVQKLADGKCWMLTNLSYGGGGVSTYGDVRTITNSNTQDYTKAYYMIPTGANVTSGTTDPSTLTNGTGQYGYLYNWCAAMGAPVSTDSSPSSACSNAITPDPDVNRSICPAGWRLPVGYNAEVKALNDAVNGGRTNTDAGLITTPWLGQRSGQWSSGFGNQGVSGGYWSSTQSSGTYGYSFVFNISGVYTADFNDYSKQDGLAVRCVAV